MTLNKVTKKTKKKSLSKSSSPPRRNAHDLLIKTLYSQPKYSTDIFKLCLSSKEYALFRWKTLKSEVNTFVDKDLQEKRADLIFSVQLKNSSPPASAKIIFLLEHKSHYDPDLMTQLLHYQTGIYSKNQNPVITVLLYHGRQKKWRGALSFQEHLKMDSQFRQCFADHVLNFKVRLVNLQDMDKKRLKRADLTSGMIFYIMSSVWNLDKEKLREFFRLGKDLKPKDREELIEAAVSYIRLADPQFKWNVLKEIENEFLEKGGKRMALLPGAIELERKDALKEGMKAGIRKGLLKGMEKGIEKGRMEGMEAVALKMLQEGFKSQTIRKLTGVSSKKISQLSCKKS